MADPLRIWEDAIVQLLYTGLRSDTLVTQSVKKCRLGAILTPYQTKNRRNCRRQGSTALLQCTIVQSLYTLCSDRAVPTRRHLKERSEKRGSDGGPRTDTNPCLNLGGGSCWYAVRLPRAWRLLIPLPWEWVESCLAPLALTLLPV